MRSISSPDPRDAASNAWRDLEAINVRATIASDPSSGIGFGRPFLQVVKVPDISFFVFWNYESHHTTLWVWMKTGAIGFILFFTLMFGRHRTLDLDGQNPHVSRVPDLWHRRGRRHRHVACLLLRGPGTDGRPCPLLLGIVLGTVGVIRRIEA